MNDISKQVGELVESNLAHKVHVSDLKSSNSTLKQEIELLRHDNGNMKIDLARVSEDRDFFMKQNAELKTLLTSASALIVEGMKKLQLAEERRQAINRRSEETKTDAYTTDIMENDE